MFRTLIPLIPLFPLPPLVDSCHLHLATPTCHTLHFFFKLRTNNQLFGTWCVQCRSSLPGHDTHCQHPRHALREVRERPFAGRPDGEYYMCLALSGPPYCLTASLRAVALRINLIPPTEHCIMSLSPLALPAKTRPRSTARLATASIASSLRG